MTARVWNVDAGSLGASRMGGMTPFGSTGLGGGRMVGIHQDHTEFVVGLAWSFFEPTIASCSWDQEVHLWS